MNIELFSNTIVRPLKVFGFKHPFFDIHLDTLIYTWVAMAVLFATAFFVRWYLAKNHLTPLFVLIEQVLTFFSNLSIESLGFFDYNYFAFATALFFFTMVCNLVALIPFCDESTKDLNTALALGLSSFCFVQYNHIKCVGIINYIKDFARPAIFVAPIEVISKLASIISMSFRLFGNILGGSIIYMIVVQAIGVYKEYYIALVFIIFGAYLVLANSINLENYPYLTKATNAVLALVFFLSFLQMFFGVFEGIVQAFVLTMLTITYLSLALAGAPRKVQT